MWKPFVFHGILFLTVITAGCASTEVKYDKYAVAKDMTLINTLTRSVAAESVLECAIICTNDGECCTSSYNITSLVCGLNLRCCPEISTGFKNKVLQRISDEVKQTAPVDRPKACSDLPDSPPGVYTIYPDPTNSFEVYCENGWTIFQRHEKSGYHFAKNWNEYKTGFGDVRHDHWLGNDKLHILSLNNGTCGRKLRIILTTFDDEEATVVYHIFHVGDELSKYIIYIGGSVGGNCMDNAKTFSTIDQDNDYTKGFSCAQNRLAGWWFDKCGHVCLNGPIRKGVKSWTTMHWWCWTNAYSLKKSVMMLK